MNNAPHPSSNRGENQKLDEPTKERGYPVISEDPGKPAVEPTDRQSAPSD